MINSISFPYTRHNLKNNLFLNINIIDLQYYKTRKILGEKLTKDVQNLCIENQKILAKKYQRIPKWRNIPSL